MDEDGNIKINKSELKEGFKKFRDFLTSKKTVGILTIIALIAIVFFSCSIRTSNISDLKDATTGNYTLGPDLDPFLYLRVAEEIIDYGAPLNPDYMRYHGTTPYYNLMPYGIAYLYKFLSIFSDTSLEYAAIILPVIFFGASILIFFLFVKKIFENRSWIQKNLIAIFSTALYAFTPLILHRTIAGVPELESMGLFFFWLSFLFLLYAWKEKEENQSYLLKKRCLFALLSGISTALMVFTWGGVKFIFMSVSISVLIAFLLGKVKKNETILYGLWLLPAVLALIMKSGIGILFELTTSVPAIFVFLVLITNLLVKKNLEEKIKRIIKRDFIPKEIISLLIVVLVGGLVLLVLKPSTFINLFSIIKESLIYPFGRQRVSLTVAENAQPYVIEWFSNFGKNFFWLFFLGTLFIFNSTITPLTKKEKRIMNFSFIIFISGFIFSRYSSASILNGENFFSQVIYFGSLLILIASALYVYIKRHKNNNFDEFTKINFSHILLLSLIVLMIVASRGAIRLFVISSPIFIIAAGFLSVELLNYWIRIKDDLLKVLFLVFVLISLFMLVSTFITYEVSSAETAKYTIPGAYNIQWQHAMSWVRENTQKEDIFVHWWDYGYWVQTLGKRATVTDGGHDITYWDHLVGRYLLTTPYPEMALSFMKTHNVSYLLIDSTDIGKYGAYSRIGSDETNSDRFSYIPVMVSNSSRILENEDGSILRLYEGGVPLDMDIIYNDGEEEIFLPKEKAYLGGIILEYSQEENSMVSFNQITGIFIYNQKQINIPIRYLYYRGQIIDFKTGIDAGVYVIPGMIGENTIDNIMAAIYLSPLTFNSLVGQLYVLNDPFQKYGTVQLVHSEQDPYLNFISSQGVEINDFFYLNGLRGPIKIWEVNYPNNILSKDEFLKTSGNYAEFDSLKVTA